MFTTLHAPINIDDTLPAVVGQDFIDEVIKRKMAEALVLIEKQSAYGPYNIARPPFGISPQVALTVRCNDKVQRLGTLLSTENETPSGSESRADTWGDLSNYGTIGGMVEDGVWPGLDRDEVEDDVHLLHYQSRDNEPEEPWDFDSEPEYTAAGLPGEYPAPHTPPRPVIYVGDHVTDVHGAHGTVVRSLGDTFTVRFPWFVVDVFQVFREDKNRWYIEPTYQNDRPRIPGFDA